MNTNAVKIRLFEEADTCLLNQILKGLIPEYFAESEYIDYQEYLAHEKEEYFVACLDDKIIAAGGINYFLPEGKARLSWDIVDRNYHGRGVGRLLAQFRINKVLESHNFKQLEVRTSQFADGFYARLGFVEKFRTSNYWGKGIHLVHMEMYL